MDTKNETACAFSPDLTESKPDPDFHQMDDHLQAVVEAAWHFYLSGAHDIGRRLFIAHTELQNHIVSLEGRLENL